MTVSWTGQRTREKNGSGGESRSRKKRRLKFKTLDAGSWFDPKFSGAKVLLLSEALDFICGSGGVALIEHKSGDAQTLAQLLRERNLINKVVVISFNWKFLREFHELAPSQVLGTLGPPTRLSNGRRPVHVRRGLTARLKDITKTGRGLPFGTERSPNAIFSQLTVEA